MQTRLSIFPAPGDKPHATMSGHNGDIPVIDLAGPYAGPEIAFHDLESAIPYLDELVSEAAKLRQQIVRFRRGQERLLAAVEASPTTAELKQQGDIR